MYYVLSYRVVFYVSLASLQFKLSKCKKIVYVHSDIYRHVFEKFLMVERKTMVRFILPRQCYTVSTNRDGNRNKKKL